MNDIGAAYPSENIHVVLEPPHTRRPKNDRWLRRQSRVSYM